MIVKLLINTSVKSLNKCYDYKVPKELEEKVELGKRVEVSFGRSRKSTEEGIIVKILEDVEYDGKYELKDVISILDDMSYIDSRKLKLAKYISYLYFCNVYDVIKLMLPPGTRSKSNSKNIDGKKQQVVKLIKSHDMINYDIENEVITSAKHIRLLKFLMENEFVAITDIIDGLGISRAVIKTVEKNGYISIFEAKLEDEFNDKINIERTFKIEPTSEQKNAIENICKHVIDEEYAEILLFGVTGSGKTEVYLQSIEKVLNQGRKVIVLVPEISLTYQTMTRFISRFGNRVSVLHSKMTISKRKEEYKRIMLGEVDIVVGARSAVFSPIKNIGMVIIDEEHDSSYYSQTTPKYSTKEVARYICKENNAVLLLGSATPETTTYYKAKSGTIELVEMKNRPGAATLPKIELVDMKNERLFGNNIISSYLKEEIRKNMENSEQTMIFLNKRGYVSYLKCDECSHIFKCPNCDVAMTYHKNSNLLLCHYCSHVEKNVKMCPVCGSINISSGSIGTQKVEDELKKIYPKITTLRMDADSTISKDSYQKILDEFKTGNIDVLIGTQMISKGHDISNVTLVGVLGVDSMLAMNDYLATEKAYSNISQVSGRAGRGKKQGKVLIQTNDIENYILDAVVNNSYEKFYESEIKYRKNFGYPPFLDIVLVEFVGVDFNLVKKEADRMYSILNNYNSDIYKVFSPKSPYIQRINNKYRINIIIKTKLDNLFYKCMYEKLNLYNKGKKSGVSTSITINPIF